MYLAVYETLKKQAVYKTFKNVKLSMKKNNII
jgi:hypothetical protein